MRTCVAAPFLPSFLPCGFDDTCPSLFLFFCFLSSILLLTSTPHTYVKCTNHHLIYIFLLVFSRILIIFQKKTNILKSQIFFLLHTTKPFFLFSLIHTVYYHNMCIFIFKIHIRNHHHHHRRLLLPNQV